MDNQNLVNSLEEQISFMKANVIQPYEETIEKLQEVWSDDAGRQFRIAAVAASEQLKHSLELLEQAKDLCKS
ncbi:MAG: hypothetical protein Q4B03_06320 [Lachnospiraceae bacterium]|nr:hypothetical protein [Lachnospiraceae bacterium]